MPISMLRDDWRVWPAPWMLVVRGDTSELDRMFPSLDNTLSRMTTSDDDLVPSWPTLSAFPG